MIIWRAGSYLQHTTGDRPCQMCSYHLQILCFGIVRQPAKTVQDVAKSTWESVFFKMQGTFYSGVQAHPQFIITPQEIIITFCFNYSLFDFCNYFSPFPWNNNMVCIVYLNYLPWFYFSSAWLPLRTPGSSCEAAARAAHLRQCLRFHQASSFFSFSFFF